MASINLLKKQLNALTIKREKINNKKEDAIKKQFWFEDNYEGDYNSQSAYIKAIDVDFEMAEKLDDIDRLIANKKAQLNRAIKKAK